MRGSFPLNGTYFQVNEVSSACRFDLFLSHFIVILIFIKKVMKMKNTIPTQVFADHDSSLNPIDVPREWLWNLPRRMVYFGTSIPSIFKG